MIKYPVMLHSIMETTIESDGHLIAQIQRQSRTALERLYERYADVSVDLAFYILRDRAMAQEVTLEAFCKVWHLAWQFRSADGTFSDWLSGIVHQLAIEALTLRKTPVYPRAIDPIEQSLTHAVEAYTAGYGWLPKTPQANAADLPIKHSLRNMSGPSSAKAYSTRLRRPD